MARSDKRRRDSRNNESHSLIHLRRDVELRSEVDRTRKARITVRIAVKEMESATIRACDQLVAPAVRFVVGSTALSVLHGSSLRLMKRLVWRMMRCDL